MESAYITTRMPAHQANANQALSPGVPYVRSERIVSMIEVNGWFSAKPRSTGDIDDVGTNDGLKKTKNISK